MRRIPSIIAMAAVLASAIAFTSAAQAQLKVVPRPPPNGGQGTGGAPTNWTEVDAQVLQAGCSLLQQIFGAICIPSGSDGSGMVAELKSTVLTGSGPVDGHAIRVGGSASGGPGGDSMGVFQVEGTDIVIDFRIPTGRPIEDTDWITFSGTWGWGEDECFHHPESCPPPPPPAGGGTGGGTGGGSPPIPPTLDPPPPPPPPPPGPPPGPLPVVDLPPPPPPPGYGGGGGDEPMCGPGDDYCIGATGDPSYGMEDY